MKAGATLFLWYACVAQSSLAAPASPEINCKLVKNDAHFGAQQARAGMSLEKSLVELDTSNRMTDEMLVKSKRKPMSIAVKTQSRMSFIDGYNEAIRQPDQPVERIAAQASLACMLAKYK